MRQFINHITGYRISIYTLDNSNKNNNNNNFESNIFVLYGLFFLGRLPPVQFIKCLCSSHNFMFGGVEQPKIRWNARCDFEISRVHDSGSSSLCMDMVDARKLNEF